MEQGHSYGPRGSFSRLYAVLRSGQVRLRLAIGGGLRGLLYDVAADDRILTFLVPDAAEAGREIRVQSTWLEEVQPSER